MEKIGKLLDSFNRNDQKKYYNTTLINEVTSTNVTYRRIEIIINRKIETVIINLDVIRNFIIKKYVKIKKYLIKIKQNYIN